MEYRTIRNSGIFVSNFQHHDRIGSRVSKDLVESLIANFIRISTAYYYSTSDHLFTYSEKQLHSAFCPALADLTHSFLIERPLIRKPKGEDEYQGNVDYWLCYRNFSFLIELKHSYFAYYSTNRPNRKIASRYNRALKQLENVRASECRNLANNKGLIKIALQVIPFYTSSIYDIPFENKPVKYYYKLLAQMIDRSRLTSKVNITALWRLHRKICPNFVSNDNGSIVFPAVGFIGNISKVFV